MTITSTSNDILINAIDGFLIDKNKDLIVTFTTNSNFVVIPESGIKLTAVDNANVAIATLDVKLKITRVGDQVLNAKIIAKSTDGKLPTPQVANLLQQLVSKHLPMLPATPHKV